MNQSEGLVMPLKFRAVVLAALMVSTSAHPNELCRVALAALNQVQQESGHKKLGDDEIILFIVKALTNGKEVYKGMDAAAVYQDILITNEAEGLTVHSFRHSDKEAVAYRSELRDDSLLVLDLPTPDSTTLWQNITTNQRVELVNRLVGNFRRGQYDHAMKEAAGRQRMLDAKGTHPSGKKGSEFEGYGTLALGISPVRLLKAAVTGCEVGVCRNSNLALVGILGELGIAGKDIRLVSGAASADAKHRHIWVEYRASPEGDWVEVDATASSKAGSFGGVLHVLGGTLGFAADGGSLKEKYAYNQKRYERVLTPIKLSSNIINIDALLSELFPKGK